MIDIAYDRKKLNDTYLLYKQADLKKYLKREDTPFVRFKAFDVVNHQTHGEVQSGLEYRDVQTLTIRTFIANSSITFEANDFIYDVVNDVMWRILTVVTDDDNQMKEHSSRPRTWFDISMTK